MDRTASSPSHGLNVASVASGSLRSSIPASPPRFCLAISGPIGVQPIAAACFTIPNWTAPGRVALARNRRVLDALRLRKHICRMGWSLRSGGRPQFFRQDDEAITVHLSCFVAAKFLANNSPVLICRLPYDMPADGRRDKVGQLEAGEIC